MIITALHYLLSVSTVDDEEVFKTCLDFWHHFCKELYASEAQWKGATTPFSAQGGSSTTGHGMGGYSPGVGMGTGPRPVGGSPFAQSTLGTNRRPRPALYEGVLHQLRLLMIDTMAKPEEVCLDTSPWYTLILPLLSHCQQHFTLLLLHITKQS